ncbi:YjzD family protein [Sporosarcina sp. FSL K6-1522]|uniref:YjzD family protein n=1 Tax=Sporosarcina sp. FSL K6-1522 TaxID=2921554 RepID=UPI00315A1047
MRFVMAFFWSFCLVSMLNYVAGSIANIPFDFAAGAIVAVILAVLVIVLGESFPDGEVADH